MRIIVHDHNKWNAISNMNDYFPMNEQMSYKIDRCRETN